MKKRMSFLSIAVLISSVIACSCSRQYEYDAASGKVLLSVSIEDSAKKSGTKVAGQSENAESTIRSIQVFVFNKTTGQVDNAIYKDGLNSAGSYTLDPMQCTVGEREIWAIVNAPSDYTGTITALEALKTTSVNLSDNGTTSLIMVGSSSKLLAAGTDAITLPVSRLCAAVVLTKVENQLLVPAYRDKLQITGAYLMNAPALQKLDGSVVSDSVESKWNAWYGKAGASEAVPLLTEQISPVTIPYNESHIATHSFYTFANVLDMVEGTDAKGRSSTYLVVECTVNGVACVYPVLLPALSANNKYNVSLTVNHVGGDPDYPWKRVRFSAFTPSIAVEAWTDNAVTEKI